MAIRFSEKVWHLMVDAMEDTIDGLSDLKAIYAADLVLDISDDFFLVGTIDVSKNRFGRTWRFAFDRSQYDDRRLTDSRVMDAVRTQFEVPPGARVLMRKNAWTAWPSQAAYWYLETVVPVPHGLPVRYAMSLDKVLASPGPIFLTNRDAEAEMVGIISEQIRLEMGLFEGTVINSLQTVDVGRYPHSCPRCGRAAYVGLDSVDCSGGCA